MRRQQNVVESLSFTSDVQIEFRVALATLLGT